MPSTAAVNPTNTLALPTTSTSLGEAALAYAEPAESGQPRALKSARRAPEGALTDLEGLPPWFPPDLYINAKHLADLKSSGWTDETARRSRVYSGSAREVKRILGFPAGPGLMFMYGYFDAHVNPDYRPKSGKVYYSSKGSKCLMYIPALLDWDIFKDPTQDLFITEGEKKAVAAVQAGIPCVAFSGVWTWRQNGQPIEDLDMVTWAGRHVYIVFDSDAAKNFQVQRAELALKAELEARGATVSIVRLPENGSKKVGLDDYLILVKNRGSSSAKASLMAVSQSYPLTYYKYGGRNGAADNRRQNANTQTVADYLWTLWGQPGPLALDTTIRSPLDPNKRRAGTRFVEWKGQVRVLIDGNPRRWPLAVAWYNGLRREHWTGKGFRMQQLSLQDLLVWDAILRHRAGETPLELEPLHPSAARLSSCAQSLLRACTEEVAARRTRYPDSNLTFCPERLALLSGLTKAQTKAAWNDELIIYGFVESDEAEQPLFKLGSSPITDDDLNFSDKGLGEACNGAA
jgi:hypothetical protein